jgi:NitT/TauT family transport system substrate-binding protein
MKLKNLLLFGLIFLFISSCGKKEVGVLKIAYIPISECMPLYVAKEKGFFEKEGIKVELISLAGGAPILNAINSGDIHIGFSNVVSLVLNNVQGFSFVAVYGATYETSRNQNHALLVNKDFKINDLANSKIAVNTTRNIEELMVHKYLRSKNVKASNDNFIATGFPTMLPLLEAGSINIASIVEPFITIANQDTTNSFSYLTNHYLSTTEKTLVATYVCSKKFIETNNNLVEKFISAMQKATKFIKENEAESRYVVGLYTKIPKNLLSKIGLAEFSDEIDIHALDSVIKDMIDFNYIESLNKPNAKDLVYRR